MRYDATPSNVSLPNNTTHFTSILNFKLNHWVKLTLHELAPTLTMFLVSWINPPWNIASFCAIRGLHQILMSAMAPLSVRKCIQIYGYRLQWNAGNVTFQHETINKTLNAGHQKGILNSIHTVSVRKDVFHGCVIPYPDAGKISRKLRCLLRNLVHGLEQMAEMASTVNLAPNKRKWQFL